MFALLIRELKGTYTLGHFRPPKKSLVSGLRMHRCSRPNDIHGCGVLINRAKKQTNKNKHEHKANNQKSLVSALVVSEPRVRIFNFRFFFCYETMSNCSQNCWIDWNSAVLCFKRLFHIGVWTFASICEASSHLLQVFWEYVILRHFSFLNLSSVCAWCWILPDWGRFLAKIAT